MSRLSRRLVPLALGVLLLLAPLTPARAQERQPADADQASLYERLGGYDVVAATVDDFLARLSADPDLHPLFVGVSAAEGPRIRQHIVDFLCAETGGPCVYHGRSMADAHAGMPITDAHFEATVGHMGDALRNQGVEDREVEEALSWLRSLRSDFVAEGE